MAHLRKQGSKWYAVIYKGKKDGKDRYDWVPLHEDKEMAKLMLAELEDKRRRLRPHDHTMQSWLTHWLETYARLSVRPTTFSSYRMLVHTHYIPAFGDVKLVDFTGDDVQMYMAEKRASGLSPTTVRYHYRILKGSLQTATDLGYILKNPVLAAKPPRKVEKEQDVWTLEEAVTFLAGIRDHRLFAMYATVLLTGLRRGEVLGLLWRNINFQNRTLWISQTVVYVDGKTIVQPAVKTKNSRRTVAFGPGLAAILKDHPRKSELVFHNRWGKPLDPHNISRQFRQLCDAVGVRRIPFHNLRHTHLTDLVAAGVHMRIVSDRAGHSSTDFTANTYAHVMPSMQEEAAVLSEQRMLGAFEKHLQFRPSGEGA